MKYYKAKDGEVFGYDPETQQELIDQAIAKKWKDITASYPLPIPVPTADQNKKTAITLLQQTDWSTIPDVADATKSNPYLSNVEDFLSFRNTVRAIAINPPEGDISFPSIPTSIWSRS
jgi:hypothetical protein